MEILAECQSLGRLPVVNFSAGGISAPADAALMMQLGCDGNFVGSGIFKIRRSGEDGQGHCDGHDLPRPARRAGQSLGGTGEANARARDSGHFRG